MSDDSEKSDAFLNGWNAHRLDVDVDANPYDERTQFFSHMRWSSGWCSRFSAIKHGLSLENDEVQL